MIKQALALLVAYPSLTITFLGTGTSTGVPMIGCSCEVCTSSDPKDNRLRSSILVESATTTLVVDTTPDFRQQMLRINNRHLNAVLFTHPHKDHIAGLDDVRAYNFFSGKAIDVYANSLTEEALKKEFAYAFSDKRYPGIPEINLITIDHSAFLIGDIRVLPFVVWHYKMPVTGFRFGEFTYITDANRIDKAEKELIKGSKIIVLNALRRENHISHFTLKQAIDLVDELQIPQAYFTHLSHQLGRNETVSKTLPPHIHLAYDGLKITI
jgi:phosphoribosyl 1,2-cyclic phosphate phosphodiesterase